MSTCLPEKSPSLPARIINPRGTVPGGIDSFVEVMRNGYCFVDKSPLVREVLACPYKVQLLTRPRRFGKTTNVNMLRAFFEQSTAKETCPQTVLGSKGAPEKYLRETQNFSGQKGTQCPHSALFDGLLIAEDRELCRQHQGKYPVIALSFKDVKESDWPGAYEHLCQLLRDEVVRHLRAGIDEACLDSLPPSQGESLRNVAAGTATDLQWRNSLAALCAALTEQYDRPPWVLLDEYDSPIHAAYVCTPKELFDPVLQAREPDKFNSSHYGRMVSLMRGLLGSALKGRDRFFHKAVITGILRVAKEDIFSGLNNLGTYGVLEDRFTSYFGFTTAETREVLAGQGLVGHFDPVRAWYDGYRFGKAAPVTIYNPWSVIGFIADPTDPPKPHWVNTSGNELVHSLVEGSDDPQDRADVETLLLGGTVEKDVSDSMALRELPSLTDALWSILLSSGYLTGDPDGDATFGTRLRIPNREVDVVYRRLITGWFHKSSQQHALPAALKALAAGEPEQFARHLATLAASSLSYLDFGGSEPERVYHALVLGMVAYLSNAYRIRSNRESGAGRPDLLLLPHDTQKPGIVMEFKC
ncbi:MAG: AAA family ATPase [Myxococcota bacterium]